jgi:hypothetical protein
LLLAVVVVVVVRAQMILVLAVGVPEGFLLLLVCRLAQALLMRLPLEQAEMVE